jgi:superfamily II DNA or RNA helicase
LKEILPDIVEDNKVIVFCFFVEFGELAKKALEEMGIKCMVMNAQNAEGNTKNRQASIDKFSNDPTYKVLLASDILREGVDIPAATYVINVDTVWNPAILTQRAGRIDRLNQKANRIYVINIWSKGTIEESMADILQYRDGVSSAIMDNGVVEERIKKITFKDIKRMLKMI